MNPAADSEAATGKVTPPRRPRRRRWPWLVFGLPVLLVGLLAGALYLVLATERGSDWLLRQLAGVAANQDVQLAFAGSRGTLLDDITLEQVALRAAGAEVEVERLRLAWRPWTLRRQLLHIETIALDGLRVVPPPAADSEPAGPPQIPDIVLPLALRLDRLQLDDAVIAQPGGDVTITHAALSAAVDADSGLRLRDIALRLPGISVDGSLGMALAAPHAIDGQLDASVAQALSGEQVGDVALSLSLAGEALQPTLDARLSAPTELRLAATARLDRETPAFDVDANWPALQWPLRGDPQLRTGAGSLQLSGTAQAYKIALRAPLALPGYAPSAPPLQVALDGDGDAGSLALHPLTVGVADGELRADGRVDWRDGVAWQLELLAERLDPGLFAAGWPGRLNGQVRVDGRLPADGELAVAANIERLAGTLRGYPVRGSGGLDWRGGVLRADGLDLASGQNRLRVAGQAGERLDLAFELDAAELAGLYPGLAGALSGSGRLGGSANAPSLDARLRGSGVAFDTARVDSLALDVDWRGQQGRAVLDAGGLVSGDTALDKVVASLDGRVDAHRLQLTADGKDLRVALDAQGALDTASTQWRGTLDDLDAALGELGSWRLRAPTALQLGPARAFAERLCLAQADTTLCLRGGWAQAAGLDLDGELAAFDLGTLARYLPGEAVIDGDLAADFALRGQPQRPSTTFSLRPGDGSIRVDDGAEPFELAYRNARLDGSFADDRGTAELRLDVGPNGSASGTLGIAAERAGQRALSGRLQADFPDLALVAGFVPALQAVQGRLAVALDLGGTLQQPGLRGEAVISEAQASVVAAGIELRDIDLRVRGDGQGPLRIDGRVASGDGSLTVAGSADPTAAGGAAVDLRIRGEDFEAVRLPEANVRIAPDLRLQGNGPYRLSGTLRIPRAAIELKELPPGTVAVSDDQVIVGAGAPADKAPAASPLQAEVRVELGDDVSFKGFGLKTALGGTLNASSGPRGTLVDGKIELRDATYKAYGQDLSVERGRLLFAGPPGNPDVDLRAVRESRDGQVKAYLAMSGPLAKPRPRVYTEPALPEAEAVAYLLTGKGLDAAGKGEGADIAGAALSLGLSRSEPLLQDLGDRLGLDDLTIESGSELADSSLLLGKYLNPNLYLGYSQGLFNPEGAVLLRLRLSERLEVESRSGTEQSVDLFYKLEHD